MAGLRGRAGADPRAEEERVKLGPHVERLRAIATSSRTLVLRLPKRTHAASIDVEGSADALALLDGELLIAGLSSGRLIGIDAGAETPSAVLTQRAHASGVRALGKSLVSAGADGALRVFSLDVRSAKPSLVLSAERVVSARALNVVAVDPGGALIASGGEDGIVRVLPASDVAHGTVREMPWPHRRRLRRWIDPLLVCRRRDR
jgi:hypothetical protein